MHLRHFLAAAIVWSTAVLAACGGGSPSGPAPPPDNFQGVWAGSWVKVSCSESGGAVGAACNQTPQSGLLRLTLTQTDASVQGSVEIGTFIIPTSGSVNGGTLALAGQIHLPQPNATGTVSNWSTTQSGNSMSGNFTLQLVADDPAFGSQTLQLSLQNVTKSS